MTVNTESESELLCKYYLGDSKKSLEFMDALTVFSKELSSDMDICTLECLRGLANLAADDLLSAGIVEGPLKAIVSYAVNPDIDEQTRKAAHSVLSTIGFTRGVEDIWADHLLLVEWYYMKKSLKAQKCAYLILCDFFRTFFANDTNDSYIDIISKFGKFFDRFQALEKFRRNSLQSGKSNTASSRLYHRPSFSDTVFRYFSFCHPQSALQDVIFDEDDDIEFQEEDLIALAESSTLESSLESDSNLSSDILVSVDKEKFYEKVYEYLDIFFPCRLMQDAFIGLESIGRSNILPYRVRSLVLPARKYFSFTREARVLNNLLQELMNENEADNLKREMVSYPSEGHTKMYVSLSFQNSTFEGIFFVERYFL
jgi:hypothetical protein